MRSPAYYWLKIKMFLFRLFWILCGLAVLAGVVDLFYYMNVTGELQIWMALGLAAGLACAVKVNLNR